MERVPAVRFDNDHLAGCSSVTLEPGQALREIGEEVTMAGFPVFRPAGSRVVFLLLLSACAEEPAFGDVSIPLLEDVTARYSVSFTAPPAPAGTSGFEANVGGAACALSDLDGDGHLDLLLTAAFGGGVWVGRGDGASGFDPIVDPVLPIGSHPVSMIALDLDGDADKDLLVAEGFDIVRYWNEGDLQWSTGSSVANFAPDAVPVSLTAADLDGDGWVDLFVGASGLQTMEIGLERNCGADHLLLGVGAGEFVDRSDLLPPEATRLSMTLAATVSDFDRDGRIDIYVGSDKGHEGSHNALWTRQDDGSYLDSSAEMGMDLSMGSMGLTVGDVQPDGVFDVAIPDMGSVVRVLSVHPQGAIEASAAWNAVPADPITNWVGWGSQFLDLENDGDLDLATAWGDVDAAPGQPDQGLTLWRWEAGAWEDASWGLEDYLEQAWRSAMVGDIDEDGLQDIVWVALVGPATVMLARPDVPAGHFVEVRLVGPPGNPHALGAEVKIDAGAQTRVATVSVGGTAVHTSIEPTTFFGLGQVDYIRAIQVAWPDGSQTVLPEPAVDQLHMVEWTAD